MHPSLRVPSAGACLLVAAAPALAGPRADCPGDFNRDGLVNPADIAGFINAWLVADPAADFDGDGAVLPADVAVFVNAWFTSLTATGGACPLGAPPVPIVFVSRQIPGGGSTSWAVPRDLPGVGPHSRVRPAAPGRLVVLEPGGVLRVLIDGASPSPTSFDLTDVNGPAVSYDAQWIAFAGLPAPAGKPYPGGPNTSPGGWRIFVIRADGSDLHQLTFSDQDGLDYSRFGEAAPGLRGYDDFDPVFLPDGRVCFASTRYPSFAQYASARTSNLYVVRTDGSRLIRLTADRNGADRPLVDPLTGRIVYSRWWRNVRLPATSPDTTVLHDPADPSQGFDEAVGLTTDPGAHAGAPSPARNYWQLITIATDGSGIRLWSGRGRDDALNHAYGGGFAPDGSLYANFFPTLDMAVAAGFGGIRHWQRGPEPWTPVIGVTDAAGALVHPADPPSMGVLASPEGYAAEPEVLPDGRLVLSWTPDVHQDYGLYLAQADGSNLRLLRDEPGVSELRARAIVVRPVPPIPRDLYRDNPIEPAPPLLPPTADGPFFPAQGTFVFYSFNVYANAPVDADIISAPAVGSAATIRFFVDQQRTSPGSLANLDWPIPLGEVMVRPDGLPAIAGGAALHFPNAPANVPLFEQLRGPGPAAAVPLTGGPIPDGAAHVAGMNFAPAGTSTVCTGCHAGHSMIAVPADGSQAVWTNLAPGARVFVSSSRDPAANIGLIDRRVFKGGIHEYWTSTPGAQDGQWVLLVFPVPVAVRTVVLYNPRQGDAAGCTIQVHGATIRLFGDAAAGSEVASASSGELSVLGTPALFSEIAARAIRINLDAVTGSFDGAPAAGLAEVEVIAKGLAP